MRKKVKEVNWKNKETCERKRTERGTWRICSSRKALVFYQAWIKKRNSTKFARGRRGERYGFKKEEEGGNKKSRRRSQEELGIKTPAWKELSRIIRDH